MNKKSKLIILFVILAASYFSYYVSSLKFSRFDNFISSE